MKPVLGIGGIAWTLLLGGAALLWVILRTGTKPSRLDYPCQKAAIGTAAAAFGAPVVAVILAAHCGFLGFLRSNSGKLTGGVLGALVLSWVTLASLPNDPRASTIDPPVGYRPSIFHVPDVRGVETGRFGGVDDLVSLMGAHGLKLHRSSTLGRTSGADGIVGANNVVIIKINAQWGQRGGTNTDVLRGIIRQIVEHPDGFVGEIVIADNGQGSGNLNRVENNAEDPHQSPVDVANDFALEGWSVTARLWDNIRGISVGEYADGDMVDGYVVDGQWDPETSIRKSYPKFQSTTGTYISFKNGIWNPATSTYDSERLVVINVPVLKTHSIYGVTASVKNHMGVITQSLGTDSHSGVGRGGLGSILADVRAPVLTILDSIWVLARPGQGPSAPYASASQRNELLASRDPVALDVWAVKNVLIPQIIVNGYSAIQYAAQDPDNPASTFRRYLDRSMGEMLLGGIATSNDYASANVFRWAGDIDRDGDLDLADFTGFSECLHGPGEPAEPPCNVYDLTGNSHTELSDFLVFQVLFTGS